jgi:hypothetical protein
MRQGSPERGLVCIPFLKCLPAFDFFAQFKTLQVSAVQPAAAMAQEAPLGEMIEISRLTAIGQQSSPAPIFDRMDVNCIGHGAMPSPVNLLLPCELSLISALNWSRISLTLARLTPTAKNNRVVKNKSRPSICNPKSRRIISYKLQVSVLLSSVRRFFGRLQLPHHNPAPARAL